MTPKKEMERVPAPQVPLSYFVRCEALLNTAYASDNFWTNKDLVNQQTIEAKGTTANLELIFSCWIGILIRMQLLT